MPIRKQATTNKSINPLKQTMHKNKPVNKWIRIKTIREVPTFGAWRETFDRGHFRDTGDAVAGVGGENSAVTTHIAVASWLQEFNICNRDKEMQYSERWLRKVCIDIYDKQC